MANYYTALLLLLLAIGGVVVRKTYNYLPLREIKRRAEIHDPLATKLYPTAAYGRSLRGLLWAFIVFTSACGVVILSKEAPVWLSLCAVILLLWATYSWLPQSKISGVGIRLTIIVNPFILWLLGHLHPLLDSTTRQVEKRYTADSHTGLYQKDDLISLIDKQQHQKDSRFTDEELEIAKRALTFNDYTINDILTPKKAVKSVLANDTVGPILIDELHKSQQEHILVRETAEGDFVGTLNFKRLNIKSNGQVKDFMNPSVHYVHEDDDLGEALRTFMATNSTLFVVVDNAEEFVGIVTIESILRQLMGHIPGEDFDQHHNPSAVVARHKKNKNTPQDEIEFIDEPEEAAETEETSVDDQPAESEENSQETPESEEEIDDKNPKHINSTSHPER